jgi:hypothetical protein
VKAACNMGDIRQNLCLTQKQIKRFGDLPVQRRIPKGMRMPSQGRSFKSIVPRNATTHFRVGGYDNKK